jgi:hypothetical protein
MRFFDFTAVVVAMVVVGAIAMAKYALIEEGDHVVVVAVARSFSNDTSMSCSLGENLVEKKEVSECQDPMKIPLQISLLSDQVIGQTFCHYHNSLS